MSRWQLVRLVFAIACVAGSAIILAATLFGWVEHKDGGLVVLGSVLLLLQSGDTLADLLDGD